MLFFTVVANAGKTTVGFERLSLEQGLSQNSVACIHQDRNGFLWFCTGGGLNRYDGYEFKVFRHDPDDNSTISDNIVNTIYEDDEGMMWIGTLGGLDRYDPSTETFTSYRHDISNPYSISSNSVMVIAPDPNGGLWIGTNAGLNRFDFETGRFSRIMGKSGQQRGLNSNKIRALLVERTGIVWIGTQDGGLNKYDTRTNTFEHFMSDGDNPRGLSHNNVVSLLRDSHGVLWVGTFGGGLNRFDSVKRHFSRFLSDENDPKSLSNNNVRTIYEDPSGRLWVGTFNGGLNRFDRKSEQFERFVHDNADPSSLSNNRVWSILEDTSGVLWIGTFGGGLNKYDTKREKFGHVRFQPNPGKSINRAKVSAFFYQDGELWIGTDGGGLNIFDEKTESYRYYQHDENNPKSITNGRITAIFKDRQNRFWVGTDKGLNRFHPPSGEEEGYFEHFKRDKDNPQSLSSNNVKTIYQDSQDRLWIGTLGGGLNLFDPQSGVFRHFRHSQNDKTSLSNDFVNVVYEDRENTLWVGTYGGGLNKVVDGGRQFIHFKHLEGDPESLSHNAVSSILQDQHGDLWVATYGGLNRFDEQKVKSYRQNDGLPSDTIYGILQDRAGSIWLSTDQGLSRFNPSTETFVNYETVDGMQSNAFSLGAFYRSDRGELFFGGINGFNRFFGEKIVDEVTRPKVVFTDFLLFNQSVPIAHEGQEYPDTFVLEKSINYLDELTLTYKESFVSFQFASMDFSSPDNNRYAYQLVGWDSDWIYTDAKNRRATYTNIPPGNYTLNVKVGNKKGVWNEQQRSLKVTVLPRPWETWWAYTIYVSIVVAVVALFASVYTERKKRMAEREVNLQLKQVDKMKDEFLANTSHELRTPLNGIIGLAESLIDGATGELPDKTVSNLAMVVASGKRLANLVNDILDFSKLKDRSIELHTKPTDIRAMVEVVLTLSKPLVGDKNLQLCNNVPSDLPPVDADEDRLQQILHNLVGNGIKYSEQGSVSVSVAMLTEDQMLEVSVKDTGIGITGDQFNHIFDSFEQVEGSVERSYSGTGLGLAVSKQLVELHGGTIRVDSVGGIGSTFSFTMPISHGEVEPDSHLGRSLVRLHHLDSHNVDHLKTVTTSSGDSRFKILIVDDEPINRQVLHNHLALQNYQLIEAADGIEALKIMEKEDTIDLILLDIMMPRMSGYEVCKRLRKTYPVNDLPIIFLTAKNQVADLVQSFAVGANDYLSKPVTKHELLTRVETHLKLLDINRNLEHIVAERTADLERKNQEVELINKEILATQDQLVQSEKMASLGTLTAGVAHEINNPTNFVHVSAQNLQVDLERFERFIFELAGEDADEEILQSFRAQFNPLYEHLLTIKDGTERIKIIVQDLRAFTQIDVLDKKAVDISSCLQSTINLVQTKYLEVAEFVTHYDQTPKIMCYAAQLNQVFMNLIVNACDAIREKQRQLGSAEPGRIRIDCRAVDKAVEISVEDNGCGMDEVTKTKLFEPFYTTKTVGEGTGLGLSISYGIVQKHGGELLVESQHGVGSKFTLTLPIE